MKLTLLELMAIAEIADLPTDEISEKTGLPESQIIKALHRKPANYIAEFWAAYTKHGADYLKLERELLSSGNPSPKSARRQSLTGQRFVFTSAQNNTEVHKPFLGSLIHYCDTNNAQLIIGQFVYNKNGFQNGVLDDSDIWYDPEVLPYALSKSRRVCPGLVWCGELNILPTVKFPLSGLEQYTGGESTIVPHAKIAMESVATAKHLPAKLMYATGCVTQHNYIQKKTGQVAESAHCYGALVVDIDSSGNWQARQIQTDESGIFQDWLTVYHPDGSVTDGTITAINWGDIHAEKSDQRILNECFTLAEQLKPDYQIFHDLFDMTSRNHHNRNNPHFLYQTHVNGESVENDLRITAEILERFYNACQTSELVIVESNHDLALERWLSDPAYDFRKDPVNAGLYLNLQNWIYNENSGNTNGLLCHALGDLVGANFLNTDESFTLHDIEFGYHGHTGINGSRGNPKQFQKLNMPMNTGHTHSASIHGQVYTAGVTGSLDMGYNVGPSSWSHSHILTYGTGFRTIYTMR